MNISFIAKPEWFKPGKNGKVYPVRLTSRVRGKEIANFLGAEYREDGKYENSIRIYLKPRSIDSIMDGDYIDLLDEIHIIPELKKRPKIKVIAMSKVHYDYLKKELKNKLFYIPHHHINLENKKRVKNKAIVGGIIGKPTSVGYSLFEGIKSPLAKVGIDFKECFHYQTRQDILDFHAQMDFQVIWFPNQAVEYGSFYRHPAKIINAASFGIPTIAQKILGHQEMEGFYIPAETYEDVAREALKLQDEDYYNEWSGKLIKEAQQYHISEIAKLYRQLK